MAYARYDEDCDMDGDFLDAARRQTSDLGCHISRPGPVPESVTARRLLVRGKPSLFDPIELEDNTDENESNNIIPGRGLLSHNRSNRPGGKPSFLEDQREKSQQIRQMTNGFVYSNDYIELAVNRNNLDSSLTCVQPLAGSNLFESPVKQQDEIRLDNMTQIQLQVSPLSSAASTPTKTLRKGKQNLPPTTPQIPLYDIIKRKTKPTVHNIQDLAYRPNLVQNSVSHKELLFQTKTQEKEKLDINSILQFPHLRSH